MTAYLLWLVGVVFSTNGLITLSLIVGVYAYILMIRLISESNKQNSQKGKSE